MRLVQHLGAQICGPDGIGLLQHQETAGVEPVDGQGEGESHQQGQKAEHRRDDIAFLAPGIGGPLADFTPQTSAQNPQSGGGAHGHEQDQRNHRKRGQVQPVLQRHPVHAALPISRSPSAARR